MATTKDGDSIAELKKEAEARDPHALFSLEAAREAQAGVLSRLEPELLTRVLVLATGGGTALASLGRAACACRRLRAHFADALGVLEHGAFCSVDVLWRAFNLRVRGTHGTAAAPTGRAALDLAEEYLGAMKALSFDDDGLWKERHFDMNFVRGAAPADVDLRAWRDRLALMDEYKDEADEMTDMDEEDESYFGMAAYAVSRDGRFQATFPTRGVRIP